MKSDLDKLMSERGIDAFMVLGDATENNVLAYMTNRAPITKGIVLKKRNEEPVLICFPMERDEAAKSDLAVKTVEEFGYSKHRRETKGDLFETMLRTYIEILMAYDVKGTLSFYGLMDPGQAYMLLKRIDSLLDHINVIGETDTTLFDEAYATKDDDELAAIESVAIRTNEMMANTVKYLQGHAVKDNQLVSDGGDFLTIGDVKQFVEHQMLERKLEASEGLIFALGRDAGVPHSRGEDDDVIKLGQTIVFDLFPRGKDSGYFHDMTRTFCLGYAPPEVERAYEQVMQAFDAIIDELAVGENASRYQDITCDVFEEHGHKTPRTDPGTDEGYVHSIGHGLGLQIHSSPGLRQFSTDVLSPRQVITIEPGLYYPEQGYGIRIEDTYYFDKEGTPHNLTPFSKDLIIPMDGDK